jgi:hypothetical protein
MPINVFSGKKEIIHFPSITQYDQKYKHIKSKNMCSLFSLITAYNYIKTQNISKTAHETNLDAAVANFDIIGLNSEMTFDNLLDFSNLDKKKILSSTVELVELGEVGFNIMFPKEYEKISYSVIFLKNSKFFVVNKSISGIFSIRDCHEIDQYDFKSKDDMINHLRQIYQFDTKIIVDGMSLDKFSNIEFIVINEEFTIHLPITGNITDMKYDSKSNIHTDINVYDDDSGNEADDENEEIEKSKSIVNIEEFLVVSDQNYIDGLAKEGVNYDDYGDNWDDEWSNSD